MTAPIYRYLGTNDSASECSCCGRTGLKRVAWLLEIDGDGEPLPYGTTCAAHLLLRRESSERKPKVSEANRAIEAAAAETRRAAYRKAQELDIPNAEIIVNKYGVRVAVRGDVTSCGTWPRTYMNNERAIEIHDLSAKEQSAYDWFCARAAEIATAWGLESRPYDIKDASKPAKKAA